MESAWLDRKAGALPIVCRSCGGVQRIAPAVLRAGAPVPCGGCGRGIELGALAKTIPAFLVMEDAVPRRRVLSEFP